MAFYGHSSPHCTRSLCVASVRIRSVPLVPGDQRVTTDNQTPLDGPVLGRSKTLRPRFGSGTARC